jgi:hypothetical protein
MNMNDCDILFNKRKMIPQPVKNNSKPQRKIKEDDNDEILHLLKDRLALGRKRYGHGVRVDDDTRQFGTEDNDWELMALEEMLDGLIYTTASIIRYRRKKQSEKNI